MEAIQTQVASETGPDQDYTNILSYLKPALVYFATARIIEDNAIQITRYGLEVKTNDFGVAASDGLRRDRIRSETAKGNAKLQKLVNFLNSDQGPDLGELWVKNCNEDRVVGRDKISISAIGTSYYDRT